MPLGPRELLLIIVVPALAALAILFVGRRAWLRRTHELAQNVGAWAGPVAACVAFVIAFPTIAGTFKVFPPKESMSYLFIAAIVATIGGLIDSRARGGAIGLRIAGVFVLAVACTAGVLRFKFRSDWAPQHASTMIVAIGGLCLIWWLAMDFAERDPASSSAMPWLCWIICSTISVVLMMNGSLKYGQLALSLAAAAGAGVLLTLVAKRRMFLRGAAVVFAIIPALIVISAHFLFDLKPLYVGLLLCTPITIAIGRTIPTQHLRSSIRALLRVAPTALLMAIIVVIAVREFRKSQAESDPNDPYGRLEVVPRQHIGTRLA
jgi:hypothetical protein